MTRSGTALVALALAGRAAAANPAAGVAFGEGLRMAQTARAQGMGEAGAASADGVTALGVNPAGVLSTGVATLHLTHTIHVEGVSEDYFAYAQRLPPAFGVGVGVFAQHTGALSRQAEDPAGNWAGDAGTYPVLLLAGSAAAAVDLSSLVAGLEWLRPEGGAAVRVVSQQVDTQRLMGVDADLGATVHPGGGFAAALVVQHLGVAQGGLGMPRQFVLGASWQAQRLAGKADSVLVAADFPIAPDRSFSTRAGLEYRMAFGSWGFAVRGGWRGDLADTGATGLAAGVGFRRLAGRFPFGLDYAFVPFGDLGTRHAIAMTFGIQPSTRTSDAALIEAPPVSTARVFYPRRGERFWTQVTLRAAATVTVRLLDARGLELAVLEPEARHDAGLVTVAWDGRLPDNVPAPLDREYRVLVQAGRQTYFFDVIPKD